ncbi:C13 family peptidase, partial [Undibacterium sp. RTI2.1]
MNNIPTADNSSRDNAFISNLKIGLRAVLFLRFSKEELYVSWSQVVLLTAIHLTLLFSLDFVHIGFTGEFNWFGLPGAIFTLPMMIIVAWAMTLSANQSDKTLSLLVVFCLLTIPYEMSFQLLNWILSRQFVKGLIGQWASSATDMWFALACGLAAIRLLEIKGIRRIILLLPVLLICGTSSQVMQYKTLWRKPYDPEISRNFYEQRHILESENVFYLQPNLLEQELAAVMPSNQKTPVLFFVGVAGYSDQDVFMKEVHYVEELFKKRFGTSGHSITLINNSKTATTSPIASTTSLSRSLKKISESMDKNKDILFLYMTSHGSKDHKFSLDFGSMQFNDLNPERLRDMLNESGIKRRVIVISACYSGGFIDKLKDSNTLIITSAAADKTSFGCSNEADFTYFGQAYFDEALQKTDSFVDAFNLAKPLIAAREKEDDYTPSDPGIFVGENIKIALAEFSHQLSTKRVNQSVLSYQQAKTTTLNKEINQDNPIKIPSALIKSPTEEKENTRIRQANQLIVLMKYRNLIEDSIVLCK